jgi:hypothetical protein
MVRLKNKAEAINIRPGRWHLVGSYDQQVGVPSQYTLLRLCESDRRFGRERNLDRDSDTSIERIFPRTIGSHSFGAARIIPMDLGGPDGLYQAATLA